MKRALRRTLATVLALVALATPARSATIPVCTAAQVMGCGATCTTCTATACTVMKNLNVTPPTPGAVCTFDFGDRNLTFKAGGLIGGSNLFAVKARSLTLGNNGTLTAKGGSTAPGGTITLTLGASGLAMQAGANPIDLTGTAIAPTDNGGGTLIVDSDGDVTIGTGGIIADTGAGSAAAGSILITTGRFDGPNLVASGSITILAPLSAVGQIGGAATSGGFGGTVSLTADGVPGSGNIDVENPIVVTGGISGGGITLSASGNVTLGNPASGKLLAADGTGDAGTGGCIDVVASGKIGGKNGVTATISSTGSAAALVTNGGGCGGQICVESLGDDVDLSGGTHFGLAVDGGPGGGAGSVNVMADQPGKSLTVGVPISASAAGVNGQGGCVTVTGNGAVKVSQPVDVSSEGGGGGIQVDALSTLAASALMTAEGGTNGGGSVQLSSGGAMTVTSPLLTSAATNVNGLAAGGSVMLFGDTSVMTSGEVNVSGAGAQPGGMVTMEAGGDVTLPSTAVVDADGGTSGVPGGGIVLLAGSPDLPGTLHLDGDLHAIGTAPDDLGGSGHVHLEACTVAVGATALVDSRGDPGADNSIVARVAMTVASGGQLKTTGGTATSRNRLTTRTGAPLPPSSAFAPVLVGGDVTFLPVCASASQTGCVTPCPQCGNSVTEFPETCDAGAGNGPCHPCDAICRTFTCDDGNDCTTDTCDPIGGCTSVLIPNCTTTTTTATTPSSTTTSTTTTSTTTQPTTTSTTTTSTTTQPTTTSTTTSTTSTTTQPTTTTTTSTTSTTTTSTTTTTTSTTTTTKPTTTNTTTSTTTTTTTTTSTTTSTSTTSTTTSTSTSTSTTTKPTTTSTTTSTSTTSTTVPTTTSTSSTTTTSTSTQPSTTTSSTSTSTGPPTTTTTLPPLVTCKREATFASVDCRLVELGPLLTPVGTGKTHTRVVTPVNDARAKTQAAAAAAGGRKRKLLGKAISLLGRFDSRLRGLGKVVDATLRADLLARSRDLKIDLRALRAF